MPIYDKEFIIRYVDGDLDTGEQQQFEADLQKDASLREEVALYRELKATLSERLADEEDIAPLKARLTALNKEYFKEETPVRRMSAIRWTIGVAAAVLLIVAGLLLWPSDENALYARLGSTRMAGLTERGDGSDTVMQRAADYFNNNEFAKALPLLDKVVAADSTNQLALFYRGVAAWHTRATAAARKDWEQVAKGESLLHYEAAFYLALSYAEEKNTSAARHWLEQIPPGTPVSARANELKASLK